MPEVSHLLPELKKWNNGMGVSISGWLNAIASSDAALAYLSVFWPDFVEIDGHVLRSGITRVHLHNWTHSGKCDRKSLECVLNHIHMVDVFTANSREEDEIKTARCKVIGKIMKDMYEAKLKADFPDRSFSVFLDGIEDSLDALEITLTFCQT